METTGRARSDTGMVRESNEDSYFVDDALGLYIVADGMGGHAGGEVASRVAVEAAVAAVRGGLAAADSRLDSSALQRLVREAVRSGAAAIHQRAADDPALRGMGTTITLLLVQRAHAAMAHVGDSRLYLVRGDTLQQLSSDHTIVASLVGAGIITREQARRGPYGKALARSVGTEPDVEVDVALLALTPGDRLLLCTDGLTDHVTGAEDLLVDLSGALDEIPESLVDFANASGGEDNVTVLVVEVGAPSEGTEAPPRQSAVGSLSELNAGD